MGVLQTDKSPSPPGKQPVIEYLLKLVLGLYIITIPFTSAFSFTGTISFPLIFAAFLFGLMCLHIFINGKLPAGFLGFDLVLILFICLLSIISYCVNGIGNKKSLNHTIAYISSLLLFYVALKYVFCALKGKLNLLEYIMRLLTYATLISAVYANTEFISNNIFDINLNDYIPRPDYNEEAYEALAIDLFYRARGFAAESGHFAFMMELLSPFVVYYFFYSGFCKWPAWLKICSVVLIFFSIIFTVSTSSFVIIPAAIFLAAFFYLKKIIGYIRQKSRQAFIVTGAIGAFILLINYLFSFSTLLLLSITSKLDSGSFEDRKQRMDFFNDKFPKFNIISKLCGGGPAAFDILGFDEYSNVLSLYYSVTFELGFIGLTLFMLLFFYMIFQTVSIRSKFAFFALVAVFSGVIHYYFISNFWYPWFWFIAAFAIVFGQGNRSFKQPFR